MAVKLRPPEEQTAQAAEQAKPEVAELEEELERVRYRSRYRRTLRNTIYTLVIVAALAILITTLWMPVIQIYGSTMEPTLVNEDIVVCRKAKRLKAGDVAAFYYNNKILVKRCVAVGGDRIEIDESGNVTVNGTVLDEPYLAERVKGECTITFPYLVPEGQFFVMSDNRTDALDSRNAAIGCVTDEQLLGKLILRVWPLQSLKFVN